MGAVFLQFGIQKRDIRKMAIPCKQQQETLLLSQEDYRTRFKNTLLGRWQSTEGSFSMISGSIFDFYPNGIGKFTEYSFGGITEEIHFHWKSTQDYTIELQEEYESDWVKIEYDFKIIESDSGMQLALYAKNTQSFWLSFCNQFSFIESSFG